MLHPTGGLSAGQQRVIWDYVEGGGALLLVAEPPYFDSGVSSNFNGVLRPIGIRVRHDVAISETGNWQHGLVSAAHPVTAGLWTGGGSALTDSGSSLAVHVSAIPLIVGRWGWSDPGNEAVTTGSYAFEPGERLGDLVLLAEQRYGLGRVLVLGDSTALTNEGLVHGHEFTSRLFDYLAHRRGSPQQGGRQVLTLLLAIVVAAVVLYRPSPVGLAVVAWSLAATLAFCSLATRAGTAPGAIQPGPTGSAPAGWRGIAYIDASHVEAYGDGDWGFDAVNGLALALMRDRYLAFRLPEMTAERLREAKLVVSVAPARQFSRSERALIEGFVRGGGIWISTVGAEQAAASQPLLQEFGLRVPQSPLPARARSAEPAPMGRFRTLFLDASDYGAGEYKAGVTFHAGWPVQASSPDAEVLVYGRDDLPIVVCRHLGRGKFVLIGDTGFAMNKNLEYIGGEPFDYGYENAHFWRWLISRLTGAPEWVPPPFEPAAGVQESDASQ
jgi:hypothetical protein